MPPKESLSFWTPSYNGFSLFTLKHTLRVTSHFEHLIIIGVFIIYP